MSQVYADLEAIQALRAALLIFAGRCHETLPPTELAVIRAAETLDGLEEKTRDQVSHLTDLLYDCYRAAAQGMGADCGRIQQALSRAERRLAHILQTRRRFDAAVSAWERQRRALENALDTDLAAAATYLDRRITALEAYYATQLTTTALALGGSGLPGLMGAAIGALHLAQGHARRALGRAGEEIASVVLSRRFGLQEVPFTQPTHGFDRVFRAPGLPLIVVESKVSQAGTLRLGQTTAGEQGSPDWLAQAASRMTDPTSAQWSPTNERLGRLLQEMGPHNVPVLAVVTDSTRGTAAVYGRQPGGDWTLIEAEIDLVALGTAEAGEPLSETSTPAPIAPPSPWSEQGAVMPVERREGAPGGAERRG